MVATFNYDIDQKARLVLAGARTASLAVAMASPPTVTDQGNTSSITGTLVADTDAAFQYLGSVPFKGSGSPGGRAIAGSVSAEAQLAGFRTGGILSVCFSTDASEFEFQTTRTGGRYRIFADDQAVALTATVLAGGFTNTFVKVAFATPGPRNIRIELGKGVPFAGIKVPNNYQVWRTGIAGLRAMILGDSYVDGGYGDGSFNQYQSMAIQVGQRLGIRDWWISGVSGEGYAKAAAQTGVFPRQRLATDVVAYAPDLLVMCLGVNDWDRSAAAVEAEATGIFADLVTQLPDTIVTVIGPWRAPVINPPQAIADAIRTGVEAQAGAVAAKRMMYFDTFAENWQQVAGRVGATSGVGNSNIHVGADGGHLVQAGHDFLGKRIADAVIRHMQALVAV